MHLGMQQCRADRRSQIPVLAVTIVDERPGHACDIGGQRIAGCQPLDEISHEEGRRVGVTKMMSSAAGIAVAPEPLTVAPSKVDAPVSWIDSSTVIGSRSRSGVFSRHSHRSARSSPVQLRHVVDVINFDRVAAHQLRRPPNIQLMKAQREQLHQFTGIILVRLHPTDGIGFVVITIDLGEDVSMRRPYEITIRRDILALCASDEMLTIVV
jgi:hypothetical protein